MVGRNQGDEDCRQGVIDVCRWRAKHALATYVKKRLLCPHCIVLQDGATGVRDVIVEEDAAGEVSLIDAMSIMVRPKDAAAHGGAAHGRRSR